MLTATEIAELDRRIAVMQAYRDGKRIECHSARFPLWEVTENPPWDWGVENYRIAPEPRKPRECYAIFPLNSIAPRIFGGATKIDAMLNAVQGGDEVVHMREVLPE